MHGDSAFTIGKSHRVCQDYAQHGPNYAIVSDGCSGSPDTDIGARLLVLGVEAHFIYGGGLNAGAVGWALNRAGAALADMRRFPDITLPNPLDATLLAVQVAESRYSVVVAGDGAVGFRYLDGGIGSIRVTFPGGAPAYPTYRLSNSRREAYEQAQPLGREVVCRGASGPILAGLPSSSRDTDPFTPWCFSANAPWPESVAVFSDGIESFHDAEGTQIAPWRIVEELMAFKTYPGAFVQRRVHAFLRDCAARGWTHHDDLAMAAVYLGG